MVVMITAIWASGACRTKSENVIMTLGGQEAPLSHDHEAEVGGSDHDHDSSADGERRAKSATGLRSMITGPCSSYGKNHVIMVVAHLERPERDDHGTGGEQLAGAGR